ncbi:MAG: tetratricopeptide repeat protein [Bacteroidota bacterium]
MKPLFIVVFLFVFSLVSISQTIENPNFAMASHPMKVTKVEYLELSTIIELAIENQLLTGSFCADKNIFVQDVISGLKFQLASSKGIPVCPASYKFKQVGEILTFQLYFPKISPAFKYLTLVEDCNNNCFSIVGIILDNEFNKEINLAYDYYEKGKLDFALAAFQQAIENHVEYPFGFLYLNVIQIFSEKGDIANAKKWYNKLKNSMFKDKQQVLARLKQQPYYKQLIF